VAETPGAASFRTSAEAYDRHIGRYGSALAQALIEIANVSAGQRALDVGCGPGALATELCQVLGSNGIAAIDPSTPFVEACARRLPGVDVRLATVEELPFPDDSFAVPSKLSRCPPLREEVEKGLLKSWSPEQISARLKRESPDDAEMQISHETIYQSLYIQSRGELRRQLTANLRSGRKRRRPRAAGPDGRGKIRGMVPIAERPPEVDDRRVPGHWEGDLIVGAYGRSFIATLVERQTRYVMLARLGSERATEHVIDALKERIRELPTHLVLSLTWDQGNELAAHRRFSSETDVDVYFCDPHSPWQRGSNENTNGLLRQYLPKRSDLAARSQVELDEIAAELNGRPRETLEWMTPAEKMEELLR